MGLTPSPLCPSRPLRGGVDRNWPCATRCRSTLASPPTRGRGSKRCRPGVSPRAGGRPLRGGVDRNAEHGTLLGLAFSRPLRGAIVLLDRTGRFQARVEGPVIAWRMNSTPAPSSCGIGVSCDPARCQARFTAGIVATVRAAAGKGFNPFSNPFQPPSNSLQNPFEHRFSRCRRAVRNAIRRRGSPTGRGVCAANSQGRRQIDDHVKTANQWRSLRAREHRENRQRRKAAWAPLPTFLQKSRSLPF